MPMIVQHIDAIAPQKWRGVLLVEFHSAGEADDDDLFPDALVRDWQTLPVRQQIIDWLEAHGIGWSPYGHFADESLMMSYRGQIEIDLPFDRDLPAYKALEAFLENPDGSMRPSNTAFIQLHPSGGSDEECPPRRARVQGNVG